MCSEFYQILHNFHFHSFHFLSIKQQPTLIKLKMALKRVREEEEGANQKQSALEMANCLMLLSTVGQTNLNMKMNAASKQGGAFKCKTCNREFQSFQALGGHRASHKKPKQLMGSDISSWKPKMHGCPICGLEFAIGQALGGHMRKHRAAAAMVTEEAEAPMAVLNKESSKSVDLCLDLNLTPLENDLKLQMRTPVIHCFI